MAKDPTVVGVIAPTAVFFDDVAPIGVPPAPTPDPCDVAVRTAPTPAPVAEHARPNPELVVVELAADTGAAPRPRTVAVVAVIGLLLAAVCLLTGIGRAQMGLVYVSVALSMAAGLTVLIGSRT